MKRVENFRYNNLVLYCKGWYKRDENILTDLGYIFSQIYGWTPTDEKDIAYMMLRALDCYYDERGINFDTEACDRNFSSFYQSVNNRMRLSKDMSFEMGIILHVMSKFSMLSKNEIKLIPPHYGKKEHFRMGWYFKGDLGPSATYTFMNKIAQNVFKE